MWFRKGMPLKESLFRVALSAGMFCAAFWLPLAVPEAGKGGLGLAAAGAILLLWPCLPKSAGKGYWEKQLVESIGNYPTSLKVSTRAGHLCRSKEESLVADTLFLAGIPYQYEEKLVAPDGSVKVPDFTVSDIFGATWYWEHAGMLGNAEYAAKWEAKREWYNRHFPGKLIVTTGGRGLRGQVEKNVAQLLGHRA